MQGLITIDEYNRLIHAGRNKTFESNEYLTDPEDKNFKWIRDSFFGKDTEKTKLFNTGSGMFGAVSTTISYYVGVPTFPIRMDLPTFVEDYVACGYAVMLLSKQDNEYKVQYLPAQNYTDTDGRQRTIRLYKKSTAQSAFAGARIQYFVFEQEYFPGRIENRLYQVTGFADIVTGKDLNVVPLDTIEETRGMMDVEETGLAKSPIYLVKESKFSELNQVYSIFDEIVNLVYSIDRKVVMLDNQFLLNTESILLLKNITLPAHVIEKYNSGKSVNFGDVGRVVIGQEQSDIQYIQNKNDQVSTAITYEEQQVRRISAITKVPIEFLGVESNIGQVGEGTRTLMHGAFTKLVEGVRRLFTEELNDILEDTGVQGEIIFPDVIAKSATELLDEITKAREALLISQHRAIKQYLQVDDEGADEEIAAIQKEDAAKPTVVLPTQNPQDLQSPPDKNLKNGQ